MPRTTDNKRTPTQRAYAEASDARAACPYAATLEAWLSAHLDQQWPPVDPTTSAALVRALTPPPAELT